MMNLLFDKCLCCFRHHSEVWISRAKYEQLISGQASEARLVLKEAIETLPDMVTLRIALAELEEENGNIDLAHSVYRTAFDTNPTPLMFHVFQRFLRRREGRNAARMFFAETSSLRVAGVLGHQVSLFFFRLSY